jgi:hypothetical protein
VHPLFEKLGRLSKCMESTTSTIIEEKQEKGKTQYFCRKLQSADKGISLSVTLPKQYVIDLNLNKMVLSECREKMII